MLNDKAGEPRPKFPCEPSAGLSLQRDTRGGRGGEAEGGEAEGGEAEAGEGEAGEAAGS